MLQQGEEVPTAVLGIDDRLARLGDVVVGALAREADVGDQLAVDGDARRSTGGCRARSRAAMASGS